MMNQPTLSSIIPDTKVSLSENEVHEFESLLCSNINLLGRKESVNITWLIENEIGYIDNVLSSEECFALRKEIDNTKSLSFWSAAGRDNVDVRSFRDADTIELNSVPIASTIWSRIEFQLTNLVNNFADEDDGSESWRSDLPGMWSPVGLNQDILFVKYPSLGYFSPHTDGSAIHDFNRRSFYSVIVYLNTVPVGNGAGTKFYRSEASSNLIQDQTHVGKPWTAPEDLRMFTVDAVEGRLLFFDQKYVHEGVSPIPPYLKYIIRSDIMSTRSPALLTSNDDQQAYRWQQEAEILAEKGKVEESIRLFRKAYKLSPSLSRYMGQS